MSLPKFAVALLASPGGAGAGARPGVQVDPGSDDPGHREQSVRPFSDGRPKVPDSVLERVKGMVWF